MKEYNEYNNKLVSVKTATLAKQNGYDVYNPECFATSEELDRTKEMIIDEWTGMIAEGYNFFCYRPTQSSLKKWLRDKKNIQVYLKPTKNKKWSVYVDQWGCHLLTDYIIKDNYEDALEKGLLIGLKKINETKMETDLKTLLTEIMIIINNEPELPEEMSDEIFKTIVKDKKGLTDFARITVRLTKKNIKDNISKYIKTL